MGYSMRKYDGFMAVSLLAAIALVMSVPISLLADAWEPFSLQGQDILSLVIHSKNPEVMYAIKGDSSGLEEPVFPRKLLRTTNGGRTWETVWDDETKNFITCFAIDPVEPGNLYMGIMGSPSGYFCTSRDGGETWDIGRTGDFKFIGRIVVHPANPNVLYLIESGIFSEAHRITYGGIGWVCGMYGIFDIGIDPVDPDVLYAWGQDVWYNGPNACKSVDGGKTFVELELPCKDNKSPSLIIDPNQPDTLYSRCSDDWYRSEDGGMNWQVFPTEDRNFYTLLFNPTNPSAVYGSEGDSVFISHDYGASWEFLVGGVEGRYIWNLIFHPQDPGVMFTCTDDGIYAYGHPDIPAGVSPAGKLPTTWGWMRLCDQPASLR